MIAPDFPLHQKIRTDLLLHFMLVLGRAQNDRGISRSGVRERFFDYKINAIVRHGGEFLHRQR